jgi:hypothetical protein
VKAPAANVDAQAREAWREELRKTPTPSKGCFKANYPQKGWTAVPCVEAPHKPYGPAFGNRPQTIGNGTDFVAVSAKPIGAAIGSFDRVTGVKGENDSGDGNSFSLQMNVNTFPTRASICKKAAGCTGWQQFIFSNHGSVFIQYWLLSYGQSCPSGWDSYSPGPGLANDCWTNGPATGARTQTIAELGAMSLAAVNRNGTDSVLVATASGDGGLQDC